MEQVSVFTNTFLTIDHFITVERRAHWLTPLSYSTKIKLERLHLAVLSEVFKELTQESVSSNGYFFGELRTPYASLNHFSKAMSGACARSLMDAAGLMSAPRVGQSFLCFSTERIFMHIDLSEVREFLHHRATSQVF